MVHPVRKVVVRPVQRSSRASHGRQRKETEAQDLGVAVGSLRMPWGWSIVKVVCHGDRLDMTGHAAMK